MISSCISSFTSAALYKNFGLQGLFLLVGILNTASLLLNIIGFRPTYWATPYPDRRSSMSITVL